MREKILIIDDERGVLQALEAVLERRNYIPITCDSAKNALVLAAKEKPDLILLDVIMPDISGFELCLELKQMPATQDTPILMLTAYNEVGNKVKALDCGAADFISKPFTPEELLARIRAHLRVKQLSDELKNSYAELKKAELLKSELAYLIVHDLKNPLACMQGWLDILTKDEDAAFSQKHKTALAGLTRAFDQEMGLLADLLDISMLADNKIQLDYKKIKIDELLNECVRQTIAQGEPFGVTFLAKVAPGIPDLKADERILKRIVLNLLGASLKLADRNSVIELNAAYDTEVKQFKFALTNDCQPPALTINSSPSLSARSAGRSLRLTFCRMAVEAHGGKIELGENRKTCSAMNFTLPLKE